MVNLATHEARAVGRLPLPVATIDPALAQMAAVQKTALSKARRNSAILRETFSSGKKEDDSDAQIPKTEEMPEESEGDDEEEDGPREGTDMTLDGITEKLTKMSTLCEKMVSDADCLTEVMMEDLKKIQSRLSSVIKEIEEREKVDDRDDVDVLLDFQALKWNFDNLVVDYYRATTKTRKAYEYSSWHMPEYFSESPLPLGVKSVPCVVRLPAELASAHSDGALMQASKISATYKDTVGDCIDKALASCEGVSDDGRWVLKAQGLSEYLRNDRIFFDYSFVRREVREGRELKMTLLKLPTKFEDEPNLLKAKYDTKIKEKKTMNEDSHVDVTMKGIKGWKNATIPMFELQLPFRFYVKGISNITSSTIPRLNDYQVTSFFLETYLFYGTETMTDSVHITKPFDITMDTLCINEWLMGKYSHSMLYQNMPRAVRLGVILWGKYQNEKGVPEKARLAWVAHTLLDESGVLRSGSEQLNLWPFPGKSKAKHKPREIDANFIFRSTVRQNLSTRNPVALHLQFEEFSKPVVAPFVETWREPNIRAVGAEICPEQLDKHQTLQLEAVIKQDTLYELTESDKGLIWTMRHSLISYPEVLPKFLQSVKWSDRECRFEARRMLRLWAPPYQISSALELLDAKYHDYSVRQYAVKTLMRLKDDELSLYLLQLVQVLKFEPYHDSPLSRFLVNRALRAPVAIGQPLFWHLKAELHEPAHCERFGVILEEYLSHCGRFSRELRKQNSTVLKCQKIAAMIVKMKREEGATHEATMAAYQKELNTLNRNFFEPQTKFQLPLDPKVECTTLIVEKCRYMSSKMVPLWLVFNNADPTAPPVFLIFKSGDDLRQDILTLQLLRLMDMMWLREGLDMRLKPYKCIATGINEHGEGVGMIEIVLDSDTTSGIQLKYGGGAVGALKMDPIDQYIREHNPVRPAALLSLLPPHPSLCFF